MSGRRTSRAVTRTTACAEREPWVAVTKGELHAGVRRRDGCRRAGDHAHLEALHPGTDPGNERDGHDRKRPRGSRFDEAERIDRPLESPSLGLEADAHPLQHLARRIECLGGEAERVPRDHGGIGRRDHDPGDLRRLGAGSGRREEEDSERGGEPHEVDGWRGESDPRGRCGRGR
ncbi:MAG: hypothetical protein AMXMBFR55_31480 [Gemmatimonadota bacterium]